MSEPVSALVPIRLMSRPSSAPSIQLFPFLAVLVCAMGALILLLIVTTSLMRNALQARGAAAAAAKASATVIPAAPPPAPSGPTPEDLAALEAQRLERRTARETRKAAISTAKRRQAEREQKWQREIAEAEITRDQRRQSLDRSTTEINDLRQRLQVTELNLSKLRDKKSKLKELQEHDTKWLTQAEAEHEKLTDAIAAAQKKLADTRRAQANAPSKYAFIPYDGASGTTRRPIYIECTSGGIRFQPENELLDESDLKGFTETFNPLLIASEKLMQYWREQLPDEPGKAVRPYVLLVVRPKGTISYYVARKMLSQLGDDFGYELIEEDFPLQLPPADPEAKLVIRRAIAQALENRGQMLAIGGRVGEPRLGQVLMGRNEELIEFGTLDDQVAASVAKQESPFTKNSTGTGKGFSVTRSPVGEGDSRSKSFQAAVEEHQRRQAQGTTDNLGGLAEHVSAPDSYVPGSLAEMTQGGPPGGSGRGPAMIRPPGRGATADRGRPGDSRTYALSDPFSREQLATGHQGATTAAAPGIGDEQTANAGMGTGSYGGGGPGGGSGANSSGAGPRGSGNYPAGIRQGKVIDIAPGGTATGGTATGSGSPSGQGGLPGRQVASGVAGNGASADNSGATSGDPNGTYDGTLEGAGTGVASAGAGSSTSSGRAPRGASAGAATGARNQPGTATQPRQGRAIDATNASPIAEINDGQAVLDGAAEGMNSDGFSDGGASGGGTSGHSGNAAGQQHRSSRTAGDSAGNSAANTAAGSGGPAGAAGSASRGMANGQPGQGSSQGGGSQPGGGSGNGPAGKPTYDIPSNKFSKGDNPRPSASQGSAGPGQAPDANAARNRTYGDNPEARQQLAALKSTSKPPSTMQKHDSARRRWGGSNTGQIGFERKVTVQVMADKIVIGKNDIEIVVEPGTSQDELVESVLEALDQHSQTWGRPPTRFYWVPYLDFEVYAGGSNNHERLNGALREWGIFSESQFKAGEKPVPAAKDGAIQPAANADAQTAIGPEELKAKSANGQPAPAKKSSFSWFKRITQGAFKSK